MPLKDFDISFGDFHAGASFENDSYEEMEDFKNQMIAEDASNSDEIKSIVDDLDD